MSSHPKESIQPATASGKIRTFSSRQDLVEYLVGEGVIGSEEDLLADLDQRWADFAHVWIRQGGTGCQFAQRRSREADKAQWLSIVANTPPDTAELDGIQELLQAAADAQAVLLLFPHARSMQDVCQIVGAFANHSGWEYDIVPMEPGIPGDGYVEIGLRWLIPHTLYRSEALGFGPIADFPITRQAPVVCLALRSHPPASMVDDNRVHLAQMPRDKLELADKENKDRFWKTTQEQRADLLNGSLVHAARARVTFRLPIGAARAVGLTIADG